MKTKKEMILENLRQWPEEELWDLIEKILDGMSEEELTEWVGEAEATDRRAELHIV